MNRIRKIVTTGILTGSLFLGGSLLTYGQEDASRFVSGTYLNGVQVGGMTPAEAVSHLQQYYQTNYQLEIKKKNGTVELINGGDFGYQVTVSANLEEILDQQNAGGRIQGPAGQNSHAVTIQASYDEQALEQRIRALDCLSGGSVVQTSDARISDYEQGKDFTVIAEVNGNSLNEERTLEVLKAAVAQGETEVSLVGQGCYDGISLYAKDPELKALCQRMNQYRKMSVTYTVDEATEVLDGETIASWLSASGKALEVDQAGVQAFVDTLYAKYTTAGTERIFQTQGGQAVTLSGPYGWKVDRAQELAALNACLQNPESQTRELTFSQRAALRGENEWGTTYVEIDLTGQHVYMVQDGNVVWDSPCVTGNVSQDHATPAGIYSIAYKEQDRVLRGEKKADGTYEYESPVSYWMPFNGGIGLHDANWRSNFGGTIYQTSGSHGCVNLPPDKAPALYELVVKGMPVICYNL